MKFEQIPSQDKLIHAEKIKAITFWESRFQFLLEHNGLRPCRVHWLLGTTGSGKSTLTKSIIGDTARENPVLIILSEETVARYAPGILQASPRVPRENLKFMSMRELPEAFRGDHKKILMWLESRIVESGCKIAFFDNITTSPLFSQRFGNAGQEDSVLKLQEWSEKMEMSFFVVVHTEKKVTDNMGRFIMGEDVRGTQMSFVSADYFYILQRFEVGSQFYPYVRTVKHRDYDPKNRSHILTYANGIYTKDQSVTFEKMNEIFVQRNVLGKKPAGAKPVYQKKGEQRED